MKPLVAAAEPSWSRSRLLCRCRRRPEKSTRCEPWPSGVLAQAFTTSDIASGMEPAC